MVLKQSEPQQLVEQALQVFKFRIAKEKLFYHRISIDTTSLMLELELSTQKLRTILQQLDAVDYIDECYKGNEHIIFFGKSIHKKILLIGIPIPHDPTHLYIFLDVISTLETIPNYLKMQLW
ncbi:MAG: hypothetical protein MI974_12770 [Chitinophagales bacterium]|nr:hypothetical protein [Chitinophagales bacterium]